MNSPHKLCGLNLLKHRKCKWKKKRRDMYLTKSYKLSSCRMKLNRYNLQREMVLYGNEQIQLPAVNKLIWNWLFLLLLSISIPSGTFIDFIQMRWCLLLLRGTAEVVRVFELSEVAGSVAHFGSYSRKMSKYTTVRPGLFPSLGETTSVNSSSHCMNHKHQLCPSIHRRSALSVYPTLCKSVLAGSRGRAFGGGGGVWTSDDTRWCSVFRIASSL